MGVDVSPRAIARARVEAAERGVSGRFEVADALKLGGLQMIFDTVIDSGLFHVFGDQDRIRYVSSIASVAQSGGSCYLPCFSDRQPGALGPAGFARTNSHRRSATAGPSQTSSRRSSRSTADQVPRPHGPGWPLSADCDLRSRESALSPAIKTPTVACSLRRRESHLRSWP